jgi:hypothetical protein
MRSLRALTWLCVLSASCAVMAQVKRTSVPIGDALTKALAKSSLTGDGAKPFHIAVTISEPANPQSPYQGEFEEWWLSSSTWRLEVSDHHGMRQTIVMHDGIRTEKDEGEYMPIWLNNFVQAINEPVPHSAAWTASGMTIDQIFLVHDGKPMQSDACARAKSKIGTGDRATDAFTVLCFDGEGRVKSYISPAYSATFSDYHGFSGKQAARKIVTDPEPGTELVGTVKTLDKLDEAATDGHFAPLSSNETRFRSAHANSEQLERLTAAAPPIKWPLAGSGNTKGNLAIYVGIDAQGHVREAWPLNSDNAGLNDQVRAQVMQWRLTPVVDKDGRPEQVEGGLGFRFETSLAKP